MAGIIVQTYKLFSMKNDTALIEYVGKYRRILLSRISGELANS